ncbi:MAG: autotransporter outer membrane beta-barrel domain-containing protein, partial [Verrucomicrobia bacterium]|nr:autotransporter outer membrane beta-barrel domain-containing protein [Verrucomicrobiota bacterium]
GEIASGKDVAVEAAPVNTLPDNWEFFITGSFGRYDQDRLTGALDGFQSDTWTTTLGLEYRIDPSLMVGIAYSYAETDTTVGGGQGDIDLTGSVISVYAVKSWDALSSGLLYSYGSYENDVSRSTGIGNSQGNADSDSNTISWMLDYALVRSENLVMGPSLDLDYGEGSIDGYRERGTGARNLSVAETSYQTMISSIGWEINYVKPTDYGLLACNLYAGWEHEYMPEDSPLTASLATTPAGLARGISPGITANGAHPGTDWLGLGVNVRLLTSGGWNCSVGYYGQVLRQSASSHIGTIGFSKSF